MDSPYRGARRGVFGTIRSIAGCYGGSGIGRQRQTQETFDRYCCRRCGFGGRCLRGDAFLGGEKESEKPVGTSANKEQGDGGSVENAPTTGEAMTFSKVEGIFRKYRCMECHNSRESNKVEADLDFSFPTTTRAFTSPNQLGNPATAPLVLAITPGAGRPMPPNGPMISKGEVQQIMDWIAAGAKF